MSVSAPLLDIFGSGYQVPPGGAATFQTPYGTAGVRMEGAPIAQPDYTMWGGAGDDSQWQGPDSAPTPATPTAPDYNGFSGVDDTQDNTLNPPENSTQAWQAGATQRYYQRKAARDAQYATRNPALREQFRQARRIAPGPGNIPGYGTPAAPPVGLTTGSLQTTRSMGYGGTSPITFDSGWSPY